jgi:hypothetical protein
MMVGALAKARAMHDTHDMPEPTSPGTELIGSKAVCLMLDIDRATLSRWVREGHLPYAYKSPEANGAYVFKLQVVEQFIADLQALADAPPADALPGLEVGR